MGGGLKTGVIQDFRFLGGVAEGFVALPLPTGPKPKGLVALAAAEQSHAHRLVEEFKDKLRGGGVCNAQLLPIVTMAGLGAAQVHKQAMAEFAHGHGLPVAPLFQHRRWRGVPEQVKDAVGQSQRRLACEELDFTQRMTIAVGQSQPVRESHLPADLLQMGC